MNSPAEIIKHYEQTIQPIIKNSIKAKEEKGRSPAGYIRSVKGKLLEDITEALVKIAWNNLGGSASDINISKKKIDVEISEDSGYLDRQKIKDLNLYNYLTENFSKHIYRLSVDKHISINDKFVMAIECKSYTENAMLKRVCMDFGFLYKYNPKISCALVQFESQLGGDYSHLAKSKYGSNSSHVIMSYFPFDLQIITLLEGERNIEKPFHKPEFYKPLTYPPLEYALQILQEKLAPHV